MTLKKTNLECSSRIALVVDPSDFISYRLMSGLLRGAAFCSLLNVRRYFMDSLIDDLAVGWGLLCPRGRDRRSHLQKNPRREAGIVLLIFPRKD